jgi:hypothetical protein
MAGSSGLRWLEFSVSSPNNCLKICVAFARRWRLVRICTGSIHCVVNPASQLTTTVMGEGSFWPCEDTTRMRWPSGVTS